MISKSKGFSLLELLIATLLSTVVLGALTYLIVESQRSRATLSCMRAVQNTGRAALDIVARDLSVAGYRGCGSMLSSAFVYQSGLNLMGTGVAVANRLNYELALTVPISGFEGMQNDSPSPQPMLANTLMSEFDSGGTVTLNYTSHAPVKLSAEQQEYRDNFASFFDPPPGWTSRGNLVTARFVGNRSWDVAQAMTAANAPVLIRDYTSVGIAAPVVGDLLYIGDCSQGTVFMVTAVGTATVGSVNVHRLEHTVSALGNIRNATADLGGSQPMIFGTDAVVATIDTTHYALGLSQFPDGAGNPVPSLFRSRFVANATQLAALTPPYQPEAEEIAPGIVDLSILFGTSDTVEDPPNRIRSMSNVEDTHTLHTATVAVQSSALEECGDGDDDDSTGWTRFSMRFERFLQIRNVRGASDS